MNLIVTTPKTEIQNSIKEGKECSQWFRTFHFKPKVRTGDKIYFVENGLIKGYGIIFDVYKIHKSEHCITTNREWGRPGDWVVCYKNWAWLKQPVEMKGFQGIRYVDKLPGIKEALTQ